MKRGKLRRLLRFSLINMRRVKKTLAFSFHVGNPVEYNNMLSDQELAQRKTILKSYPRFIGINTSAVCNQKCVCCYYDPKRLKNNNFLTPELFERMKWLRFIERIELFSYSGEPLVNPRFPEIVKVVRKIAPHSKLGIFTNGLALEGENLEACLGLDSVHVSLNGASREVYEEFTHGDYDHVMRNLTEFARRKKQSKMYTEISMILTRVNAFDVKTMIDLAAKFGFNRLVISMCYTIPESEQLNVNDDVELAKQIRQLQGYAQSKGTDLYFPGTTRVGEACVSPWIHSYIGVDIEGEPLFSQCCYGGVKTSIYLKDTNAYVDFKRRLWNHPRIVEIRRTVNLEPNEQNAMCYLCRAVDKTVNGWQDEIARISLQKFGKITVSDGDFWPSLWEKVKA